MNYRKIYSLAIAEILKGNPLRMCLGDGERDTVMLNSYCICFLPKDKNIFALKTREFPDKFERILPKGELVEVRRTDTLLDTKPKARLMKTADDKEYPYLIDNTFLGCFNQDAEIKVNPHAKASPFYIYENRELAGIIAPIRQR